MKLLKQFEDGTTIEQGRGSFDDYCVFLSRPNRDKYAPTDEEYFSFFIEMARKYTPERIYDDFVQIYDRTSGEIDMRVLSDINAISDNYEEEDSLDFNIWYSVIYLAMVAEERKKNAILKKRIKRLGVYQILFDDMSAKNAACYSVGKRVSELDPLCKSKGF